MGKIFLKYILKKTHTNFKAKRNNPKGEKDVDKLKKIKKKLYLFKDIAFMSHLACADEKIINIIIFKRIDLTRSKKNFLIANIA